MIPKLVDALKSIEDIDRQYHVTKSLLQVI